MNHTLRILAAAGFFVVAIAGCKSKAPESTGTQPQASAPAPMTPGEPSTGALPQGHPPIGGDVQASAPAAGAPAAPAPAAATAFSGTVVETMNAANYTYVQVDTGKDKVWAAAPQFEVKKGDKVNVPEGMPMANYHSASLNRDFPVVYFVSGIGKGDQAPPSAPAAGWQPPGGMTASAQAPAGMPPAGMGDASMPEGMHPKVDAATAAKDANVSLKGIKKADKTVADIFAQQAALSGKEVSVRGKVVKFNAQIMGKNWIHLQDGTGAAGTNDLTITTAAGAKVGDTVLVKGNLSLNRDFGMGYKYGVIIEDAQVKVE